MSPLIKFSTVATVPSQGEFLKLNVLLGVNGSIKKSIEIIQSIPISIS